MFPMFQQPVVFQDFELLVKRALFALQGHALRLEAENRCCMLIALLWLFAEALASLEGRPLQRVELPREQVLLVKQRHVG